VENGFCPHFHGAREHGSNIMGIGTLVHEGQWIGRSEWVLGLIERNNSLVSDDVTTRSEQLKGERWSVQDPVDSDI